MTAAIVTIATALLSSVAADRLDAIRLFLPNVTTASPYIGCTVTESYIPVEDGLFAARGVTTTYSATGQVLTRHTRSEPTDSGTRKDTFEERFYDEADRLILETVDDRAINRVSRRVYEYSERGELLSDRLDSRGNGRFVRSKYYSYYPNGRLRSYRDQFDPDPLFAPTAFHFYDSLGRLVRQELHNLNDNSIESHASLTWSGGQLIAEELYESGDPLPSYRTTFHYEDSSARWTEARSFERRNPDGPLDLWLTTRRSFDGSGRIAWEAIYLGASHLEYQYRYEYDSRGRLSKKQHIPGYNFEGMTIYSNDC
jgi:hypothetical protein